MRTEKEPILKKESIQKIGKQEGLDFRSKEEKKKDLRARIVREREEGTFLPELLTQEEQMLRMELEREDREGDKYIH